MRLHQSVKAFPYFRRVEVIGGNVEHSGKDTKLFVRNVAEADFNLRQGGSADVQACPLATGRQFVLAYSDSVPQPSNLWTHNIDREKFPGHGSK